MSTQRRHMTLTIDPNDLTEYLTLRQREHGLELHQDANLAVLSLKGEKLNSWPTQTPMQQIWTEADVVVCQMDNGISFERKVE